MLIHVHHLTNMVELQSIIVTLDVDKYTEWWQPELNHIGYDSVFKRYVSTCTE